MLNRRPAAIPSRDIVCQEKPDREFRFDDDILKVLFKGEQGGCDPLRMGNDMENKNRSAPDGFSEFPV